MAIIISRPGKTIDYNEWKQAGGKSYVGHRHIKDERLYGDKRCMICGGWIHWVDVEPEYCFEGSVSKKGMNCGGQMCMDYYDRMVIADKVRKDAIDRRTQRFIAVMRKRGLIA